MSEVKTKSDNANQPSSASKPLTFVTQHWQITTLCIILAIIIIGLIIYAVIFSKNSPASIINSLGNNNYSVELTGDLHITTPGTYQLTGEIADGIVRIKTEGEVKLILDNVTIKNSQGPAIFVENAENVTISMPADTENYLEDGKTYKGYEENEVGVIFSHDDLILEGEGKLTVKSNNLDGIASKDDLTIKSGTYEISAPEDAIYGKDSVTITTGDFQITAAGKGIKSTNTDEDKGQGVMIAGGTFALDCTDDAIHSNSDVNIDGGDFTISSGDDAMHADGSLTINSGKINITKSHEGLEGENVIINDGEISLVADDDGINAAGGADASGMMERPGFGADKFRSNSNSNSAIRINGGKIIVNADGDGLDSNGSMYITGGETIVYGPTSSANAAIDYDGEMTMTGGTLIAGGASGMTQGLGSDSTVYNANIFFSTNISPNTKVTIINSSNQEILSYTSSKSFNSFVIASPKLQNGQTYTIKLGTETYDKFTISAITTQVGTNQGMMGGKPGGMNIPDRGEMPNNGNMPGKIPRQ